MPTCSLIALRSRVPCMLAAVAMEVLPETPTVEADTHSEATEKAGASRARCSELGGNTSANIVRSGGLSGSVFAHDIRRRASIMQ